MPLAKNTSVGCLGSIFWDFLETKSSYESTLCSLWKGCLNLCTNTHYSNNPFRVGRIISASLSALVFTGTSFPREVMIAILLGSISVPVFTNIIQDTVRE